MASEITRVANDDEHFDADCKTIINDHFRLNSILHTYIRVKCPANCLIVEASVFGINNYYSVESSICRAAIMEGLI